MWGDIVSFVFIGLGSFFMLTSGLGILRMPSFYTRLHPVGVGDSLGIILVLAGLAIQSGLTMVTLKLIILGFVLLITGPTASHALAKAALFNGLKPHGKIEKW